MSMHEEMATPTREQVAQWEARASELRTRIADHHARERELSAALADGYASGAEADVAALAAERRAAQDARGDLEVALPLLEDQIARGREVAARGLAQERLHEIKRVLGGHAGEHPRRLTRLEAAADAYRTAVEAINTAWREQQALLAERATLVKRFPGVATPDVRVVGAPGRDTRAIHAVHLARFAVDLDEGHTVRRPSLRDDSPTAALLLWAGWERPDIALTPEELAARNRDREQAAAREQRERDKRQSEAAMLGPSEAEAVALAHLPLGGGVHRG